MSLEEVLSDSFLDEIQKKYPKSMDSLLIRYAHERETLGNKIVQIRKMWTDLPPHLKSNKLFNDLHNSKEGNFRGGLSELISAWVLSKYFSNIQAEVSVGSKTPDFYAEFEDHSFLFEVYSLGADLSEKTLQRHTRLFKEELKNIKSKYRIFLEGKPTPNAAGNFDGLGMKIEAFISNLTEITDESYVVEHQGTLVTFGVFEMEEVGPIYVGGLLGVQAGDDKSSRLLGQITKKKDKYPFPHVQICVVDGPLYVDKNTLIKSFIGNEVWSFVPKNLEVVGKEYSNDGFWGLKNSEILNNLHLQGLLVVIQRHTEERFVEFELLFAENLHLRNGLANIFKDVPLVFSNEETRPKCILRP